MNSQPIIIIPTKPKTVRKKHSSETILVIFALYNIRKSQIKIANYVKIPKLIVIKILQLMLKNPNKLYSKTKHIG